MFVGFDTSNYTTSVATYDNEIKQAKQILTVKSGERGLRQSDAVFQHTVNIPNLIEQLNFSNVQAVGVSNRPRNVDGSYMPCFLVGEAVATAVAKTNNVPLYKTSHQVGHILAALYSADKLDLINDKFIAFHLSGGTTEALLVTPDKNEIVKAQIIAQSMDLKAGQAIDRTGVMLGITFPCGKEIDRLSAFSDKTYKIKPSMKGLNCSLSGVENKAKAMFQKNESAQDISKFVLTYITSTICAMLDGIFEEYGQMPVLFSGGVSSNSMIKKTIENKYGAYFAAPEFSLDNAAGVAVYANLKLKL
jgi:N6-L-threonylcarbamoyladenine synthase